MDIGIKIFPQDLAYAKRISRYCDFFEVMAIHGKDFRHLKAIGKPMTIHMMHARWGVNLADPKKARINRIAADTARKAADILSADTIVVHPGIIENSKCSVDDSINFIRGLDSRFIIENMPKMVGSCPVVGGSFEELRMMLKKTKKCMCLDFPHAAIYARCSGLEYILFIKKLLGLKPGYFHISDTRINDKKDMHLHLKEGDMNIRYLESLLPKDSRIAIENNHEFIRQHRDIDFLRNRN